MQPGGPPIDDTQDPVEDLKLAKRLDWSAPSKAQAALEREGLARLDARRKTSRAAAARRTRAMTVAVVLVVVALILAFLAGLL